jgi:hypothetical protein
VSSASIAEVSRWFEISDAVDRFRMNVLIDGVPSAFWEDTHLIGDCQSTGVVFGTDNVQLMGVMPCFRCVVPSRVPSTSPLLKGALRERGDFKRVFEERRADKALPQLTNSGDHYHETNHYHFGISTLVLADGEIAVGDRLRITRSDVDVQQTLRKSCAPLTAEQNETLITRAYALFELDRRTYTAVYYLNRFLPSAIASFFITRRFFTLRKPTAFELAFASTKVLLGVALLVVVSMKLLK